MSLRMKLRCLLLVFLVLPAGLVAGQAGGPRGNPASPGGALALEGKKDPTCRRCRGTGLLTCSVCKGKGGLDQGNGRFKVCWTCSGRGKVRCRSCTTDGIYDCPPLAGRKGKKGETIRSADPFSGHVR